jgi:hypothetical protein
MYRPDINVLSENVVPPISAQMPPGLQTMKKYIPNAAGEWNDQLNPSGWYVIFAIECSLLQAKLRDLKRTL